MTACRGTAAACPAARSRRARRQPTSLSEYGASRFRASRMERTMNVQLAVCANELDRPARSRNLSIDRFTSTDGFATLVCHGCLTLETSSLFKSEVKSLSPRFLYLMADLRDVDFVDSNGLGDVVAAFVSARSAGCELKLINVHPHVKDLLNMERLASVLEERVWEPGSPSRCRYCQKFRHEPG